LNRTVFSSVDDSFYTLLRRIRNELLLRLAEKEKPASTLARILVNNFDSLPKILRNELLLKLSKRKNELWQIILREKFQRDFNTIS